MSDPTTPKPSEALPLPLGYMFMRGPANPDFCVVTVYVSGHNPSDYGVGCCGQPESAHKPALPLIEHEFKPFKELGEAGLADASACEFCWRPKSAHRAEPPTAEQKESASKQ